VGRGLTECCQESLMFHLMKIEPTLFLVSCAPMKPRVPEVPLQVPSGSFSLENQRAGGNRTGKRRWTCSRERGAWSLQRAGGGSVCLWNNSFIPAGRGGNRSEYRAFTFTGVARHSCTAEIRQLLGNRRVLVEYFFGS